MISFPPDNTKLSLEIWDQPEFENSGIKVDVLRLDKIHPVISGNKWFKLRHFLKKAECENKKQLLSFGGYYSNHLLALAALANIQGFSSVGIIRGERPKVLSHILKAAESYGMQLEFLSRSDFTRLKKTVVELYRVGNRHISQMELELLTKKYPNAVLIPEGGAGILGVLGAEEILAGKMFSDYTHICCATGTGTTLAGIVNATGSQQMIIGISVLKGTDNMDPVDLSLIRDPIARNRIRIFHTYHFGGYAKWTIALIDFMNDLYRRTAIPTDFVYTAKLFYAVIQLAAEKTFEKGSRILVLHSGGLQGNYSLAPGILEF